MHQDGTGRGVIGRIYAIQSNAQRIDIDITNFSPFNGVTVLDRFIKLASQT